MRTFFGKYKMNATGAILITGAVLALTGSSVLAQDVSSKASATSTAKALPSAEKIIDDYVAAIGGAETLSKFATRRSEGTLDMAALGIKGKMTLLQSKPNKFLMSIDIPGIGTIKNGCDGKQVWESSVISGNRILEGTEREQMLRRTRMAAEASWREDYAKVKTTGEGKVGDRPVWIVELTPKTSESDASDKVQTDYYDQETKLLLRTEMTVASPMGDIEVESNFSDYRDVDGIKISVRVQAVDSRSRTSHAIDQGRQRRRDR
jgi:zinc protease